MSDCSPSELLGSASCFSCLGPDQLDAIQTELLCQILNNGGGGGGISGFTEGSVVFISPAGTATEDNANFFYDDTNNELRVGTSTLTFAGRKIIRALKEEVSPTGTNNSFYSEFRVTGAGTGTVIGNLNVVRMASGSMTELDGFNGYSLATGGTITTQVGGVATVQVSGATTTDAIGIYAASIITSGIVTNSYGASIVQTIAGGTITTNYGLRIQTGTGGTITNRFGLHITAGHAADKIAVLKMAATPTGNPLEIRTSADAVLTFFDNLGKMNLTMDQAVILTNQVDGAGAGAGTLANAPAAGDPAFWVPISVNGANRFFPVW